MRHLIVLALMLVPAIPAWSGDFLAGPDTSVLHGDRIEVDLQGNVYLLEGEQSMIRAYSHELSLVREIGGQGWHDDQFDHPMGIWARNGIDLFVADYGNHRIQRFDRNLAFVSSFSTRDSDNPDERFGYPSDVTLSRLGDLFICDTENSRILKVNRFSTVERAFGGFGAGKGRLQHPTKIEIGPSDVVYVLDGTRIVTFDNFGNYLGDMFAGLFAAPVTLFADQNGLIVASDGKLYFFDAGIRPVNTNPSAQITKALEAGIIAVAAMNGTLYLSTVSGLITTRDPRILAAEENLDKMGKTH